MYKFLILAQQAMGAGRDGNPSSGLFGFDWGEIITAILALVGTATAGFWAWKKTQVDSTEKQKTAFYDMLLVECQRLRELTMQLQTKVGELQNEVVDCKERLIFYEENHLASEARRMLEHVVNANASPQWIHAVGQNKWYLNNAYCKLFSVTRSTFWHPVNIFARYDNETVLAFVNHDLQVVSAGMAIEFRERCPVRITDPNCTEMIEGVFVKTPFKINENAYVVGELKEILSGLDEPVDVDELTS